MTKISSHKPGKELLFLALGGSGEIGMNVNLYGCDGKWLMVDLGMTFGANEYPGTELVFADLDFIEERKADLIGIVLTHAHEDHIGAVPYFAQELGVPLYATPFTAALVTDKLEEAGIAREIELNVIDHLDEFQLGPFGIRYVPLAHSIAEGNALVIETPYGRIFHTGDWKLDDAPLVGTPATTAELTAIGEDARRFEAGSHNLLSIVGLRAAMELVLELGVEQIGRELLRKRALLVPELQAKGYTVLNADAKAENASGIVTFFKPGEDMGALHAKLSENKIVTSLRTDRQNQRYIRFSPHYYNTDVDLQRALELV